MLYILIDTGETCKVDQGEWACSLRRKSRIWQARSNAHIYNDNIISKLTPITVGFLHL
jgi:hypothetical protein